MPPRLAGLSERAVGKPMVEGEQLLDPGYIRVEPVSNSGEFNTCGLHLYEVHFEAGLGRCFITTGEALHLTQLNTEWVERALLNLAARRGWDWVQTAARSSPGLLLHWSDAADPTAVSLRSPT